MKYYKISEISAQTGISAGRLRLWEKQYGLIMPLRSAGGFRLYRPEAITLIQQLKIYLEQGLTIKAAVQQFRLAGEIDLAQLADKLPSDKLKNVSERVDTQLGRLNTKLDLLLEHSGLAATPANSKSDPPLSLTPLFEMTNRIYDPLEVLREGLKLIFSATGADVGFIYLLNPSGQYLNLVLRLNRSELPAKSIRDLADEAPQRRVGQGISGRVAASSEPIFLADASVEPRISSVYVREQPQGVASVPISTPRSLYGVITIAHLGVQNHSSALREYLLNASRLLGWVYENWQTHTALNQATSQRQPLAAQLRLLLIEQQTLFRHSLVTILNQDKQLKIVAELDNSRNVIGEVRRLQPNLVLLDINVTDPDAVSLIRQLKAEFNQIKIIVLGVYEEDWRLIESFKAGASGYLLKTALPEEFALGVQTVWAGRYLISPRLAERLLKEVVALDNDAERQAVLQSLSQRELAVLRGLTHGSSTKTLAQELNISTKTLNQYISAIYRKLNVGDRVQLTLFAIQHGLV